MPALRIAARFLRHSRGQTVLIVLGIAVAVSVQLFVGLLIGSLQAGLVDAVVGNSSQVTITSSTDDPTFADWEAILQQVRQSDAVTASTVTATSSALLSRGNASKPGLVRGFELDSADAIYGISDRVYAGTLPTAAMDVLVGRQLSEEFSLDPSGTMTIVTANGSRHEVAVVGLFDLRVASINAGWVLTSLETAQRIFGFGDEVTAVEMQVRDVFAADAVADQIEERLGNPDLAVEDWKEQNQQVLSGLQAQSVSSTIIQAFILIAIVIAIASVLAITVLQKSRQIGILKAMGIKDRQASLVFLYEGLLLGAGGAAAGILLGIGLLTGFSLSTAGEEEPLIRIVLDYGFIALSALIAVGSSILAALIPARRSSRLSPIDVIRSG